MEDIPPEGRDKLSRSGGREGLSAMKMLRRLSEWQYTGGGSYHGTSWDPREKDWELGGVQYEWFISEDGTWMHNPCRFRVVEIYYDASDNDLPQYEESHMETCFLTALPEDIVRSRICPLVIQGFGPLQSIQAMIRVRRVCRAWRLWVDYNDDWKARVEGYRIDVAGYGRPWHSSPGKLKAVEKALQERGQV